MKNKRRWDPEKFQTVYEDDDLAITKTKTGSLPDFYAAGCGAWVGDRDCGKAGEAVEIDPLTGFLMYRTAHLGDRWLACLCRSHWHDVTADCPPDRIRRQEAEYEKWLRL